MKKQKVLQLCHDTKGPFVSICAMYLHALNPEHYEVHTVFLRGEASAEHRAALHGSTVHSLNLSGRALRGLKLGALHKVLQLCRQQQFDLVIAHRYKAIYIAGLASLFSRFTLWGVAHTQNVFIRPGRRLFVSYFRNNIALIGVSQSVADNILATCPALTGKNRVFSLPNCLDENTEQRLLPAADARARLGLSQSRFVFGTIGRLVDAKAHDVLIKAYAQANIADSTLVIIGAGPNLQALQALTHRLHISDKVIFSGHVPQAVSLLKAFDSFVFSSNEEEAFGVAVLEAMMAKRPVICSDAAGPAEVIGNAGLVFKQNQVEQLSACLQEMAAMPPSRHQRLGLLAYERWQSLYTVKPFRERFFQLLAQTRTSLAVTRD